jgi:hypothetical protein
VSQLYPYDPARYTASFGEVDLTAGVASGTFFSLERTERSFSLASGAMGDATLLRNRNKTGMFKVTLQSGSPVNDLLSGILTEAELFGPTARPLLIKDLNGNTVVDAPACFIEGWPTLEAADEQSNREWTILCAELNVFAGGSVSVT